MPRIPTLLVPILTLTIITGCGGDDTAGPTVLCEYSGITQRDASGILIGSEDADDWCPEVMALPNPVAASGAVVIEFELARSQSVRVAFRDESLGEIRVLVQGQLPQGTHRAIWDLKTEAGRPVSSGVYCATVAAEDFACSGDIEVL